MPLTLPAVPRERFDAGQLDILTELVNIGVGRSAASLSDLIGARIELQVPSVRVCSAEDEQCWRSALVRESTTLIIQQFHGAVHGKAGLLFDECSGLLLAQLLAGLDAPPEDLDVEISGMLLEVGNIVLNGVMGSLSNQMQAELTYTIPVLVAVHDVSTDKGVLNSDLGSTELLLADVDFGVAEHEIHGSIVIAFVLGSVSELLTSVCPT